jgi:hypothetical protein
MLYSIPSERLLMEDIDYKVVFCWFIGANRFCDATTFTNNRERLLDAHVAREFRSETVK